MLGKLISVTQKLQEQQAREIYLRKSMELGKADSITGPSKRPQSDFSSAGGVPVVSSTAAQPMPKPKAPPKKPAAKPAEAPTVAGTVERAKTLLSEHYTPEELDAFSSKLEGHIHAGEHDQIANMINEAKHRVKTKSAHKQIMGHLHAGEWDKAMQAAASLKETPSVQATPTAPEAAPVAGPKPTFSEWKTPATFPAGSPAAKPTSKLGAFANFVSSRGVPTPAATIDNSPISSTPADKHPATAPGVTDPEPTVPDTEMTEAKPPSKQFTELVNMENVDPALLKPLEELPLEATPEVTPEVTPQPAPTATVVTPPVKTKKPRAAKAPVVIRRGTDTARQNEIDTMQNLRGALDAIDLDPSQVSQGRKGSLLEQEAKKEKKQREKAAAEKPVDEEARNAKLEALKEKIKQGKYKAGEKVAEAFVEGGQK